MQLPKWLKNRSPKPLIWLIIPLTLSLGSDYIIPKPMDPRLITEVSSAVARAAVESGVARKVITDWDAYTEELRLRIGSDDKLLRNLTNKAKQNPKRIVFAEADTYKILRAAQIVKEEGIATPILLGDAEKIRRIMRENEIELGDVHIIDPTADCERIDEYAEYLYNKRQRRGVTLRESKNYCTTAIITVPVWCSLARRMR